MTARNPMASKVIDIMVDALHAAQEALLNGGGLDYEPAGYRGKHIGRILNEGLAQAQSCATVAPDAAVLDPPRIVQVLEDVSARSVLYVCGLSMTPPVVALDDRGVLWAYGPEAHGSHRLGWCRLPLPPLPADTAGGDR